MRCPDPGPQAACQPGAPPSPVGVLCAAAPRGLAVEGPLDCGDDLARGAARRGTRALRSAHAPEASCGGQGEPGLRTRSALCHACVSMCVREGDAWTGAGSGLGARCKADAKRMRVWCWHRQVLPCALPAGPLTTGWQLAPRRAPAEPGNEAGSQGVAVQCLPPAWARGIRSTRVRSASSPVLEPQHLGLDARAGVPAKRAICGQRCADTLAHATARYHPAG